MSENIFRKCIAIVIIALGVTIAPNIFLKPATADAQQTLLRDDFTKDISLNATLWVVGGSEITYFAKAAGEKIWSIFNLVSMRQG